MEKHKNLCTKCHAEPRSPGQRWGKKCRAKWMREHRKKKEKK